MGASVWATTLWILLTMSSLPPGVDGFKVDRTRATHTGAKEADKALDNSLKGKMFYWDVVHPDGSAGHKFMGEIAAQVGPVRVTGLTGGIDCPTSASLLASSGRPGCLCGE